MAEHPDCKIAVLDVDKEWGHRWGAGTCDLRDPLQWPFAAAGRGIDGADSLAPEAYQYSQEHWLAQVGAGQWGRMLGVGQHGQEHWLAQVWAEEWGGWNGSIVGAGAGAWEEGCWGVAGEGHATSRQSWLQA